MSAMASAIWSSRWWMKPSVLRRRRPIVAIDELVRSTGQRISSDAGCFTAQGRLELRAVDRDVGQIESHERVAAGESFVDQTIEHPACHHPSRRRHRVVSEPFPRRPVTCHEQPVTKGNRIASRHSKSLRYGHPNDHRMVTKPSADRRAFLPIKSCRQRTKGQCRQPLSQQYPRVARHEAVKTEKPLTGSRYEARPASHARPWRLMISSKCR